MVLSTAVTGHSALGEERVFAADGDGRGELGSGFGGTEGKGQGSGAVGVAIGGVGGAVVDLAIGGDDALDGMEVLADGGG